jgi:ligand-binding SRPBCC domain-containing protein
VYPEPPGGLHFEYTSLIRAPVEIVFAFHERPDAIERLTPPWQQVTVVRRTGGLETGAMVEFRIAAGPFTIRWLARHIAYEKNRLFVDQQVAGPLRSWVHAHVFCARDQTTRLTDIVHCELPGGRLSKALAGFFVRAWLRRMFRYRHQVTRAACESPDPAR